MDGLSLMKLRFLQEMGLRSAMSSAIACQPFYKDMPTNTKEERQMKAQMIESVSNRWRDLLLSYKGKYQQNKKVEIDDFIADVLQLQSDMTEGGLSECFKEPGFSLGRAQKSLSIFLKYMWLYGEIGTPPACPIDRGVLNAVKKKAKKDGVEITLDNWTELNDEEEYRKILHVIESLAEGDIAIWELEKFNEDIID